MQSRRTVIIDPSMASPHMLRPYSSRQLSLVAGEGRVVVLAILGGRFAGPTALVHLPTLQQRLDSLPRYIETVAFIDEPVPDGAVIATVDDMIETFLDLDVDALAQYVPASEAVKRVSGDRISENVDRSSLVAVRAPEVLRRTALFEATRGPFDGQWANPTALVAGAGGSIRFSSAGTVLHLPA